MKKNEEYALTIYDVLISMFDEENENHKYNLEDIDGTEFFTGLIKASGLLFNRITNDNKDQLEFTHLANALIVQNMLKNKEE